MPEPPDPLRSGSQLRLLRTGQWLTASDVQAPVVVFVHGLASSSSALAPLTKYVDRVFSVAVFDYVSHDGIDCAARELAHRLETFASDLRKHGFALVGHSLGGLVAKHLARFSNVSVTQSLRGLATLGSPHGGASPGIGSRAKRRWLALMLDQAERNERPDPFSRSLLCPSVQQLLGYDARALIDQMLDADRRDPLAIPFLSFSGGRNYVELFEPGTRWNVIANKWLQSTLTRPNDGLVEESSADMTRHVPKRATLTRHCNDYPAWPIVNHTYLMTNQDIGEQLVDWLRTTVFR